MSGHGLLGSWGGVQVQGFLGRFWVQGLDMVCFLSEAFSTRSQQIMQSIRYLLGAGYRMSMFRKT